MDLTTTNILPTKTWLYIIGFLVMTVASSTFTLTLIYSEFLLHGEAQVTQAETHNKDIITLEKADKMTNDRIDKITGRNKDAIDKLTLEIKELQLPNSDTSKN